MSVLLHGALIGVLVYGYLQFRRPPPPVTALAIDATVVSQSTLDAARRPPTPAPPAPAPAPSPPPVAEQVAPPPPDPAAQQAAQQAEAAHEAAAAKAEAAQAKAAADREAARQQAAAAQQREAAEAQAKEKEKEKAEREAKAKAKAAEQAEAQAKAAAAAKAQAQAQAAASQAELQKSIAAEERLDAARNSGAMSSWAAQIQARIQRAWIKPPSARSGLDCTLYVTQVPGGEIVNVKLGSCNGDDAVKQSILDAAYRASPLPPPPDPALFERNLELYFRPTD
jgi:colicin import membrane protein